VFCLDLFGRSHLLLGLLFAGWSGPGQRQK